MNRAEFLNKVWIHKKINPNCTIKIFKWYELGIAGVGKDGVPFLPMDQYFDNSMFPVLYKEIEQVMDDRISASKFPVDYASLIRKDILGKQFVMHYTLHAEKYFTQEELSNVKTQRDLSKMIYDKGLTEPSWSKWINIRWNTESDAWSDKHANGKYIFDVKGKMPNLYNWIENEATKIFKSMGRIIIFENNVGKSIDMHRDAPIRFEGSNLHHICFQFHQKPRNGFIYNELTGEKVYIKDTNCYTFNDSDLHGFDVEDERRITFRIDGVFHDHICKEIGYQNGLIWGPYSKSYDKLKNIKVVEPTFDMF